MNDDVIVKDGNLFFGSRKVEGVFLNDGDVIPKLYVIRTKIENDDVRGRFVCGLDLSGDKFWLGSNESRFYNDGRGLYLPPAYYDSWKRVEYMLNNFVEDTIGKEWYISIEDAFETHIGCAF